MSVSVVLETPRLILRRVQMSDVEGLHEIFKDSLAVKYWSHGPHTSIDQTFVWVQNMYAASHSTSSSRLRRCDDFIVCLKSPSGSAPRVIGKLGIWKIPEIGFIFIPTSWGKGIASEALNCFLEYFWDVHKDAKTVVADVDPRNEAALRLLIKSGFVKTGFKEKTFELEEGWCDSVYLTLYRPETKMGD